jgi:hypothetical protein
MFQNSQINSLIFSFLILLCAVNVSVGQEQQNATEELEDVPPPSITLSQSEADQLKAENDLKQRTRLCLQLADNRLQQAETLTNNADFHDALSELGGYQAVINDGLNYFKSLKEDNNKVRDNVKRLEIALRSHAPRLETIRRSTPFEYSLRLKSILNFARNARSKALSLFFGNTVLPTDNAGGLPTTTSSGTTTFNSGKKQL